MKKKQLNEKLKFLDAYIHQVAKVYFRLKCESELGVRLSDNCFEHTPTSPRGGTPLFSMSETNQDQTPTVRWNIMN